MRIIILLSILSITILCCRETPTTVSKSTPEDTGVNNKDVVGEVKILSRTNWVKNVGLTNIESVIYDSVNGNFFASCGLHYEEGYTGYISKISADGELLKLKWIDSLSRPTGMAIFGRKFFVADINQLVEIDIDKGVILNKFKEPLENSGLNDVAISSSGEVFVSASSKSAIFKLVEGELQPWVMDDEHLKWVNGILVDGYQLVGGGKKLTAIDLKTKELSTMNYPPEINDIEGIGSDGRGGYYITTVDNSALWHLSQEGQTTRLLKDVDYFGDLEVILPDRLIIPRGNHTERDFYLSRLNINADE